MMTPPATIRSIVFFHPEGNSPNNPTLDALEADLRSRGVAVFFFPKPLPNDRRHFRESKLGRWLGKLQYYLLDHSTNWIVLGSVFLLRNILNLRLLQSCDLIVGVDRNGLMAAYFFSRLFKKPYALFSFEIGFESETGRRYKEPEIAASRGLSFWVIQDEFRAKLLQTENRLQSACIKTPVASRGLPPRPVRRTRDTLGIPRDRHVAILMGNISPFNMPVDILKTVERWPGDWVLLINDRYGLDLSIYFKGFEHLLGARIFINREPFATFDSMSELLAGVDAGLVFYKPTYDHWAFGLNSLHIGLSSGKLSTCLRNSVPILTNLSGEAAALLTEYNAGALVSQVDNLPGALAEFSPEPMRDNAKRLFLDKFDFALSSEAIWSAMLTAVEQYHRRDHSV